MLRHILFQTKKPFPILHTSVLKKKIHWNSYDWKRFDYNKEFNTFILSATNCILVISICWGFEQYFQNIKLIQKLQTDRSEILYECLKRCKTRSQDSRFSKINDNE